MKRIDSIDFTRGLVMIIMALDHVRDLVHVNSITQNPTDLSTTSPALFFTRWITYLCAPTFVFLAGTSVYISFQNKGSVSESRKFLFKRGLWLVLLEFTIVNFGIGFDAGFHNLLFEVIATIGFGFIFLGLLLKLSSKTIAVTGLVIIFSHGLFPLIPFAKDSILNPILSPLFQPGAFRVSSRTNFIMGYPPVPWLGIMLTGFASGKLFELSAGNRKKRFLQIGLGAVLLFTVLRFINIYGNPVLWAAQKNALYTFLSFMNLSKYPPSLLFCLITLGIMFLVLAFAEQAKSRFTAIVDVYGKVPLFYFLVHFYLVHILMIALMFLQGFHWADLDFASGTFGRPKAAISGVGIGGVYLIWIAVVLVLYKPCLWFGKYKATHKQSWLKYI
jgi:uncharacterized membrane protein